MSVCYPRRMGETAPEKRLESALLFMGRAPLALAHLLRIVLPPAELTGLAKAAGRRRAGATDPAETLAEVVIRSPKTRQAVVERMLAALPDVPAPPEELLAEGKAEFLSREALLAGLRRPLLGEAEADWSRAAALLLDWGDRVPPAADTPAALVPPSAAEKPRSRKPAPKSGLEVARREKENLSARLKQQQVEVARLEKLVGESNRRNQDLERELAAARTTTKEQKRRATDLKRRLERATTPRQREQELAREAEDARRALHVLQQKFEILRDETEDLHGVLQDMDRYLTLPTEEVPSFRDRPLQPEEAALAEELARRAATGAPPLGILVVGGGEPQYRHLSKFEEYAERMGFASHWRMAEYTSWHKEIKALAREMDRRYDALVILHWNRTTFTRKAREICNQAGQKPCLTCYYEGFVSLRQTIQECLRQLLAAERKRKEAG